MRNQEPKATESLALRLMRPKTPSRLPKRFSTLSPKISHLQNRIRSHSLPCSREISSVSSSATYSCASSQRCCSPSIRCLVICRFKVVDWESTSHKLGYTCPFGQFCTLSLSRRSSRCRRGWVLCDCTSWLWHSVLSLWCCSRV